jgi:hypothetical protein
MSVILFFGFAAILLIISSIYVGLVIRHHYKLSKVGKSFSPAKNDAKI